MPRLRVRERKQPESIQFHQRVSFEEVFDSIGKFIPVHVERVVHCLGVAAEEIPLAGLVRDEPIVAGLKVELGTLVECLDSQKFEDAIDHDCDSSSRSGEFGYRGRSKSFSSGTLAQ